MMKPTHQLSPSWILLIAAASVILATTTTDAFAPQPPTLLTMTSRTSMYASQSETSFQRARLAEQLRLSNQVDNDNSVDDNSQVAEREAEAATVESVEDAATATTSTVSPDLSEEAKSLLALEMGEVEPFAPMMTYQKYLTMQVSW